MKLSANNPSFSLPNLNLPHALRLTASIGLTNAYTMRTSIQRLNPRPHLLLPSHSMIIIQNADTGSAASNTITSTGIASTPSHLTSRVILNLRSASRTIRRHWQAKPGPESPYIIEPVRSDIYYTISRLHRLRYHVPPHPPLPRRTPIAETAVRAPLRKKPLPSSVLPTAITHRCWWAHYGKPCTTRGAWGQWITEWMFRGEAYDGIRRA